MKYEMWYNFIFNRMILQPNKVVVIAKAHIFEIDDVCLCFLSSQNTHDNLGEIGYSLGASSNRMLQV